MTYIASCPIVVEAETEVGPLVDPLLVLAVEVLLVAELGSPQLVEDDLGRWIFDTDSAALAEALRLPTTVNARPVVALET